MKIEVFFMEEPANGAENSRRWTMFLESGRIQNPPMGSRVPSFEEDGSSWILALEVPDLSKLGARKQARVHARKQAPVCARKQAPVGDANKRYRMEVMMIDSGEDLQDKIKSFFRDREQNLPNILEDGLVGSVLSAIGSISNPMLCIRGSPPIRYEGSYFIVSIGGIYSNGVCNVTVNLNDSSGKSIGGLTVGPLIAATPVQVVLGYIITV